MDQAGMKIKATNPKYAKGVSWEWSQMLFLVLEMYTGVSLSLLPVPEPVGAVSILFVLLQAGIFT